MRTSAHYVTAIALTAASFSVSACGGGHDTRASSASGDVAATPSATSAPVADTMPRAKHHSKLAGAAAGAVAGHMLGGHAVAGAAVGALVQHERNKHGR